MVLVALAVAVMLVVSGFGLLASSWGFVLIGCGLFVLTRNALR